MARLANFLMVLAILISTIDGGVEACTGSAPTVADVTLSGKTTSQCVDLVSGSFIGDDDAHSQFSIESQSDDKFTITFDAGEVKIACDASAIQAAGIADYSLVITIRDEGDCVSSPITFTITFTDVSTTPAEISPTSVDVVRDFFETGGGVNHVISDFNVTGADNVASLVVGATDPANTPVTFVSGFTMKVTGNLPAVVDIVNVTVNGVDGTGAVVETFYVTVDLKDRPRITSPSDSSNVYFCENVEAEDDIVQNIQYENPENGAITISVTNEIPTTTSFARFAIRAPTTLIIAAAVPEDYFDVDVPGATTQYFITLSISDGTYSSEITITANVDDVNDNAPVIDDIDTIYTSELTAAGSPLYTFTVTDSDRESPNNETTLTISGENSDHFVVEGDTLKVATPSPLDYGTVSVYALVLNATDNATDDEELWTAKNVAIQLETEPVLSSYTVNMPEDIQPSATVETLSATDEDNTTSLTYSISGSESLFFLDGADIKIKADANLLMFDRDSGEKSFELEVTVSDQKYTTTATVTIEVTDVNDLDPQLGEDSYTVSINENTPSGANFLNISATDGDATSPNKDVTYALSGTAFEIDPETGAVAVKDPSTLNYTEHSSYNLTVTASDGGNPVRTDTAPVTVTMETTPVLVDPKPDVQDEPLTDVPENTGPGIVVYTMSSTDEDGGDVTYDIVSVTPANDDLFEIVESTIKTKQTLAANALDVDPDMAQRFYNISIRATDGKYPVDGIVLIGVSDVNDNPPVFGQPTSTHNIPENATGEVTTVMATDADLTSPNNQIISYAIVDGDPEAFFDISSTGSISVIKTLKEPRYTLTVRATDGGSPALTTDREVIFAVDDDVINECLSNPCQNGATCRQIVNFYHCECVVGWGGQNCQLDLDDCTPNPCQNGGECIDGLATYTCNCTTGWRGTNCTEACTGHTHGRNCAESCSCNTTNTAQSASSQYCSITTGVCICNSHWTGTDCNTDATECTQGASLCTAEFTTCRDTVGGYVCICSTGYQRNNDVCQVDNSSNNPFKLPASVVAAAIARGSTLIYLKASVDITTCPQLQDPEIYNRIKQQITQQEQQIFGLDVFVFNITCGSINYETFIEATSEADIINLSTKLKEFKESGTLVLDNVEAPVTNVEINGNTASATPPLCETYTAISPCGTDHECTLLSDGVPKCREIEEDNLALILGLGIGLGCGLIFIALCILLGYRCLGPKRNQKRISRRRSRYPDEHGSKQRHYDNSGYSLEPMKHQPKYIDNRPYHYKGGSYLYNGRY